MTHAKFKKIFDRTTERADPYPYQISLATDGETLSALLNIPTGLGKTDSTGAPNGSRVGPYEKTDIDAAQSLLGKLAERWTDGLTVPSCTLSHRTSDTTASPRAASL